MVWAWVAHHPYQNRFTELNGQRGWRGSSVLTEFLREEEGWLFERLGARQIDLSDLDPVYERTGLSRAGTDVLALVHLEPGCLLEPLSHVSEEMQVLLAYYGWPPDSHTTRITVCRKLTRPCPVRWAVPCRDSRASASLTPISTWHCVFEPASPALDPRAVQLEGGVTAAQETSELATQPPLPQKTTKKTNIAN